MQGSLADAADLNATKQIDEMAKKAHELMQHQQEIEKRVSQRWGDVSTAGDSWAGHYLPAVQVGASPPALPDTRTVHKQSQHKADSATMRMNRIKAEHRA